MHNGYWRTHSAWIAIVAGFVTFCLPATIVSQHDANDSVTTFVASAVQDLPVRVAGFKAPQRYTSPPNVIVHNASKKTVRNFTLETISGNPLAAETSGGKGCCWFSNESPYPQPKESPLRSIGPGQNTEVPGRGLDPSELSGLFQHLETSCIYVVTAISDVEFDDGTTWTLRGHDEELQVWRESLKNEAVKPCSDVKAESDAWKRTKCVRYGEYGVPTGATQELLHTMKVHCSIAKERDGGCQTCTFH
jgi:hypothetical protein